MMQYIILFLLLANVSTDADAALGGLSPVVFPTAMPSAAQMISDLLSDDDTWRAGIDTFLRNSSTNISFQDYVNGSNQTKLIIA
jgi:hypothetical protein